MLLLTLLTIKVALSVLPLIGIVETTKETFTGTLTGTQAVLVSDNGGPSCAARLSPDRGEAYLTCSDGRTGFIRYQLNEDWRLGTGHGHLGGEPFTLVLG